MEDVKSVHGSNTVLDGKKKVIKFFTQHLFVSSLGLTKIQPHLEVKEK